MGHCRHVGCRALAAPVIYYGNPSTEAIRDAMSGRRLGCIITPDQYNANFPDEWDVIADNGCFSGRWTHDRWLRWLMDQPRSIRFVVAPDVYHPDGRPAHIETLDRWRTYGPLIERLGFTPAFVCQVGANAATVPDAPVMFLGGTTEWKLGWAAWEIAHLPGTWTHMGRVNSLRRLRAADAMGCDSADGTYLTFGPDINLPRLLGWLDRVHAEPALDLTPGIIG